MTTPSIFSQNFLLPYLEEFHLSSVTNIRNITEQIELLNEELESGKISSLKEEEFKPRFISTFFGDILGFNYGNADRWQLRDEKKSKTDGTKADAVLGYLFIDKNQDDVRVVIEIKDANTDLDSIQNRPDKQSPVSQAFGYASKSGGNCKWVIVSNIKETRFYPALDQSKYQVFYLEDLKNQDKLKELLFLFHKDRFIKELDQSYLDQLFEKSKSESIQSVQYSHIIDKIYYSLKKFEGLNFVDPNFIAKISPFNILNDHVWHYEDRNLFTLNPEIYELMMELEIENSTINFSKKLTDEISNLGVKDANFKLEWSFKFLNMSQISHLSSIKDYKEIEVKNKKTIGFSKRSTFGFEEGRDGITKNIWVYPDGLCECYSCTLRRLSFRTLLTRIKSQEGNDQNCNLELAYGNYLVADNNFKSAYSIYKTYEAKIKGKQNKGVEYFLAKLNLKYLYNLVMDYGLEDSQMIIEDLKYIDLDKVLHQEIEFDVDPVVKEYLVKIKEDYLINRIQEEVEDILLRAENLHNLYLRGGKQTAGPNLPSMLIRQYHLLYLHVNQNHIIYDVFRRYRNLSEKIFKGLITLHEVPEYNLKEFNVFLLIEAILHVSSNSLKEILQKIDKIRISKEEVDKFLERQLNFINSYVEYSIFSDPHPNTVLLTQLANYRFKDRFNSIFSNLFTILSRVTITHEQFAPSKRSLIDFIKIEKELYWYELEEFIVFIQKQIHLFNVEEIIELLKIAFKGHEFYYTKYSHAIKKLPSIIRDQFPEYKLSDSNLIRLAISKAYSENGVSNDLIRLVPLYSICDDERQNILRPEFDTALSKKFDSELYWKLVVNTNYEWVNQFQNYVDEVNNDIRRPWKDRFTNPKYLGFIYLITKLQIPNNRSEFGAFTGLNDFESWMLYPATFDYKKFNVSWLKEVRDPLIWQRLNTPNLKKVLNAKLKREYDPFLAEVIYRHLK